MRPGNGQLDSATMDAFRFPKLNGQNYANWSIHMQSVLQAKYLWLVITGVEICPAKPADPSPESAPTEDYRTKLREYLDWVTRDGAAQGLMRSATDESQWPHVTNCETSKDMWDIWKQVHQTNQQLINVHYFFEELYTRKYVDGAPMADHIAAILDIRHRIVQASEVLDDLHIARAMILSLPKTPSWEMIKIQLFDIKVLTSDIVSTKLQTEANRRVREKPSGSQTALQVSGKGRKGNGPKEKQNRAKAKHGHGPQPDDVCWKCKETGHWGNQCPNAEQDDNKKGHSHGRVSAHAATCDHPDGIAREAGSVYMATKPSPDAGVILDCGATAHMFCDRSLFASYKRITGHTVSVGDARDIPVAGYGCVRLRVRVPSGHHTTTLHGVMHVPKLAMNLISLGALQDNGASYRSMTGGLVVLLGEDEILHGELVRGLYRVDCTRAEAPAAYEISSSASMRTWH